MFYRKVPVNISLAEASVLVRSRVVAMLGSDAIDMVGQAPTWQGSRDSILAAQPDGGVPNAQLEGEGGFGLQVLPVIRRAVPGIAFVVFRSTARPACRRRAAGEEAKAFLDEITEFDQSARAVLNAAHLPAP